MERFPWGGGATTKNDAVDELYLELMTGGDGRAARRNDQNRGRVMESAYVDENRTPAELAPIARPERGSAKPTEIVEAAPRPFRAFTVRPGPLMDFGAVGGGITVDFVEIQNKQQLEQLASSRSSAQGKPRTTIEKRAWKNSAQTPTSGLKNIRPAATKLQDVNLADENKGSDDADNVHTEFELFKFSPEGVRLCQVYEHQMRLNPECWILKLQEMHSPKATQHEVEKEMNRLIRQFQIERDIFEGRDPTNNARGYSFMPKPKNPMPIPQPRPFQPGDFN